jgi:hypothetical protein
MTDHTMAAGFTGWCRTPGRSWRRLCDAETYDDAIAEPLRAAGRVPGPHRDLVVLPIGRHPADPPTKYARVEGSDMRILNAGEGEP